MVEIELPGKSTNRRWMKVLTDDTKFNQLMNLKPDTKVRNLNRTLEAFEQLNTFDDLVNENNAVKNKIAGNQALAEEMEKRFLQITQGLKAILEAKLSQARSSAGKQGGSVKTSEKEEKMKAYEDKIQQIIDAYKSNKEMNNNAKKLILEFGQLISNKDTYKQRYMQELKTKFEKEMSPIISAWRQEDITGTKLVNTLLGKTFDSFSNLAMRDYTVNELNMSQTKLYLTKFAKRHKQLTMPRSSIKARTTGNRIDVSSIIFSGNRLEKMVLPLLEETDGSNPKSELNAFVKQAMNLTVFSKEAIELSFAADIRRQFMDAKLENNRFRYFNEISMNPSDNADAYFLDTKYTQEALRENKNLMTGFSRAVRNKLDTKEWQSAFTLYIEKRGKQIDAVKDDFSLIAESILAGLEKGERGAKRIFKRYERRVSNAMSLEEIKGDDAKKKKFARQVKNDLPEMDFEYNKYEQDAKMRSGILIPSSLYESTVDTSTVKQQWGFLSDLPTNDNFDEALYTTFVQIYYNGEPEKIDEFLDRPQGEVYKDVFSVFQFIYAVNFIVGKDVGANETSMIKTALDKIKSAISAAIKTDVHDTQEKRGLYLGELKSGRDFLTIGADIDKLGNVYADALKENREQIPLLVKEQLQLLVDERVKVEQIMGMGKAVELFAELVGAGFLTITR